MLWWVWDRDWFGRPYVQALDRHPRHERRAESIGVYVRVRTSGEARELARALNRRQGIPMGWPGDKPRADTW